MALTEGNTDSIEFPVPSDEWQLYVDAFSETSKRLEDPNPFTAAFQLENGEILYVINTGDSMIAGTATYTDVPHAGFVDLIYEAMPPKYQFKKPYDVNVTALREGKIVEATLRFAEFKFSKAEELTERTGGVIHNPPY
ncbi:hypothetical protein GCM10011375_20890 [Hymenobacter qilianensis]|uniref:Uncharacterized protein n=1 Tax=Hymenobacter qilianensis TaxID=1385715 RepID=A0ACB5PRX2_9BACT|nr:hypothetical protein [Hymenobacter qilianensis]GGF65735.1 hypothetical protein GCM10011375_20890 [Hymenobacter qilianensis]